MSAARALALAGVLFLGIGAAGCVEGRSWRKPDEPDAVPESWFTTWDQLKQAHGMGFEVEPVVDAVAHVGSHLTVRLRSLRAPFRAPQPKAELLVVVEGEGTLHAGGRSHRLEPGQVALLPAGTRKLLQPAPRRVLHCLVVEPSDPPRLAQGPGEEAEAPRPPPPGAPVVLGLDELLPVGWDGSARPMRRAALPGLFSLHALSCQHGLPYHAHHRHDALWFLIRGEGTLALGTEGGRKWWFSRYPLSAQSLVYLPAGAPHSYVDATHVSQGGRTLGLVIYGPELDPGDWDEDRAGFPQAPR